MTREEQILEVLRAKHRPGFCHGAEHMCRLLNLNGPCGWCPVEPPLPGDQCAIVPQKSYKVVQWTLRKLCSKGQLIRRYCGMENYLYVLSEVSAKWSNALRVD